MSRGWKIAYGAIGIIAFALVLFCAWSIDARDNREEANIYAICKATAGEQNCFRGRFVDPWEETR